MVFENDEQRQGYESLSKKRKEAFDDIAKRYPHWDYEKVMKKMALDEKMDEMIEGGGKDADPNNPQVLEAILTGANAILQKIKGISQKCIRAIESAISTVKDWISQGIRYLGDKINIIFSIFG